MNGVPDPLYVRARAVLLDAVEALDRHREAFVLVGAQAIYLHTGDADLAVPAYTTDADLAVSPYELADSPLLSDLLTDRGFVRRQDPGSWVSGNGIYLDIMAPEALAGPGRRGAALGPHGRRIARRCNGLEGALVDRDKHTIAAFDPSDRRQSTIWVAGPGALLVAKIHKIKERAGDQGRAQDKDALDVLRLLRATDTDDLAARIRQLLGSDVAHPVTVEALQSLPTLFGNPDAAGVAMAVRAAEDAEDPATIAGSLVVLADDLQTALTT